MYKPPHTCRCCSRHRPPRLGITPVNEDDRGVDAESSAAALGPREGGREGEGRVVVAVWGHLRGGGGGEGGMKVKAEKFLRLEGRRWSGGRPSQSSRLS